MSKVLEELIVRIRSVFDASGFQNLKTNTNRAVAANKKLASSFKHVEKGIYDLARGAFRFLAHTVSNAIGTFAGLVGFHGFTGLIDRVKEATLSLVEFGGRLDGIQVKFRAVLGDARLGNEEFTWLEKTASRLKVNVMEAADAYSLFYAAASGTAGKETTREIFKSWLEINRVMHLTPQVQERVMYALREMYSKGTVYSGDLIRQIGSAIAGTSQFSAEAMGLTVAELKDLMSLGQLTAAEFVPKFTGILSKRFGTPKAIADSLKQIDAAVQGVGNAFYFLKKQILDLGAREAIQTFYNSLSKLLESKRVKTFVALIGDSMKRMNQMFIPVTERIKVLFQKYMTPKVMNALLRVIEKIAGYLATSLVRQLDLLLELLGNKKYRDTLKEWYAVLMKLIDLLGEAWLTFQLISQAIVKFGTQDSFLDYQIDGLKEFIKQIDWCISKLQQLDSFINKPKNLAVKKPSEKNFIEKTADKLAFSNTKSYGINALVKNLIYELGLYPESSPIQGSAYDSNMSNFLNYTKRIPDQNYRGFAQIVNVGNMNLNNVTNPEEFTDELSKIMKDYNPELSKVLGWY